MSRASAFFCGSRCTRNGSDHRPVVLVHHYGTFGLGPQLDRDVVVTVAEDARFDGQVAHAFAETLFAANRTAFDDQSRRLAHSFKDADLRAERIHQRHFAKLLAISDPFAISR